mgnify:CR=1 FL=1
MVMAEHLTDDQKKLAAVIDHTLLRADATAEQVRKVCAEARTFGFAAVCINPCYVRLAAQELAGSGVRVATVAGFPLGANATAVKAYEAERAIADGAQEVDMVLNIGALKAGDLQTVEADIRAVVEVCHAAGALLKVILETGFLTDAEKIEACRCAVNAGADFVKTSTGFGPGGATAADVALMRATVGPQVGVKAAGGIRTYAAARQMLDAGANRLGTSAGVQILQSMV